MNRNRALNSTRASIRTLRDPEQSRETGETNGNLTRKRKSRALAFFYRKSRKRRNTNRTRIRSFLLSLIVVRRRNRASTIKILARPSPPSSPFLFIHRSTGSRSSLRFYLNFRESKLLRNEQLVDRRSHSRSVATLVLSKSSQI